MYEQRKVRENNQTNRLSRSFTDCIKKIARKVTTSHFPLATSQASKSGFTLIELLVYMAIMSFIIVVAGRVFSDSTAMRIRSQNLLKSSAEIGKLANLLTEDISQMGVKAWLQNTSDGDKVTTKSDVYWDISNEDLEKKDFSSYVLIRRKNTYPFADSLVFRKAVFDDNGNFTSVREIALYNTIIGDSLFRRCRVVSVSDSQDEDCKYASDINAASRVLMATNITNFKLTPSIAIPDTLFPPKGSEDKFGLYSRGSGDVVKPSDCKNYSTRTEVSGFTPNPINPPGQLKHELYLSNEVSQKCDDLQPSNCYMLKFDSLKTYVIEFKMPFNDDESTQFQPGVDHLSIGLRTKQGIPITGAPQDVLFYPPQDAASKDMARHIEFSFKKYVEACVAITLAFYSPTDWNQKGEFTFEDFKVFRKTDESIHFPKPGDPDYNENNENYGIGKVEGTEQDIKKKIKEKKSVKAFELMVEMKIGKEERKSGTFSQKGRGIIVATPNNGVIGE
ncbi:MAG: prepilin-type N-terminal cleavage/methylation domain-containing protein [Fibromonadaceae bacterium]|nr:prepilin-type N-terminal cleavage/methylation domain-containing protein [Fibromonadaceae bacterium]